MVENIYVVDATMQTKECYPLTINKPNALITIFNKSLLEHLICNRCSGLDKVVIVVKEVHLSLFLALSLPTNCVLTTEISYLKDASYTADAYYPKDINDACFTLRHSWDLISCAERYAAQALDSDISKDAIIEQRVTIKGNVVIGKRTVLKSGTYIEGDIVIGDDCIIGPNCYIRGSASFGDRPRVANGVDLKSVIVGCDVNICHLSYLGDSVVDDDVNIGAGFICSNLRHDKQTITTKLLGNKLDTGRQKLGVVIGRGSRIGIRTSVYPGRRIWSYISTPPNSVVDKDIEC